MVKRQYRAVSGFQIFPATKVSRFNLPQHFCGLDKGWISRLEKGWRRRRRHLFRRKRGSPEKAGASNQATGRGGCFLARNRAFFCKCG